MSRGRKDDPGGGDFLSRWSQRKRARPEAEAEAPDPADAPAPPDPVDHETEAETLERLGLPDPDTLEAGDDFRAFMARAVPEYLRRRALRKLWVSNPVLANLDGLNDYDTDFTGGSVPTGTLKTAYTVGKGIFARVVEAAGPDDDAAPDADTPERVADAGRDALPRDTMPPNPVRLGPAPAAPETAPEPVEIAAANPAETPEDSPPAPRRRMRFDFDAE
ncbi:DUF3306 domain-containing protein [Palleronia sediminis]|uniref:DUF3306 domain-containing protein n=1 Tax=Palleronia sediminis TaxID=2547833 RepID=A0A4R6AE71_9RHOB|nr:DUF3306 domain-containing protein [Palleronia sediminis]TDL79513.1 DUF3306 domain-containing protein [Palleronia sediminis]